MNIRTPLLLGTVLLLAPAARAETRRLAVIVGNNAGSGAQPALRYAESDAARMARVLLELGQVGPDDLQLLEGQGPDAVIAALERTAAQVAALHRAPDAKVVVVFYFSGHSDGEVLELGQEGLPFSRLHALLSATGADVRLSIVDSCRSGAAIQQKGGHAAPAFAVRLTDELSTRGEALLASSAQDEVALESRELGGSYFTHALISGLRGAADTSGDQQVTLAEAYEYAYQHTVASTSATLAGAQHPVYDFKLTGQGDLVLARLGALSSQVVLPLVTERLMVLDVAHDQLVAEVPAGAARRLSLEPGAYRVQTYVSGKPVAQRFTLAAGEQRTLGTEWSAMDAPLVASKGELSQTYSPSSDGPVVGTLSVQLGVEPGFASTLSAVPTLSVGLRTARWDWLELGLRFGTRTEARFTEGTVALTAGALPLQYEAGPVWLAAGVLAGAGAVWQTATGHSAGYTPLLEAGPQAQLALHVWGPLSLVVQGSLQAALLKQDGDTALRFVPGAGAGVAATF